MHDDAHTGNYFLEELLGGYKMTMIDFDNAQQGWFIVDIGTVTWDANMGLLLNHIPNYEEHFGNFKKWILEAYQWPTTDDELQQGCNWRREFMEEIVHNCMRFTPKTEPTYWSCAAYYEMNEAGLVPTC